MKIKQKKGTTFLELSPEGKVSLHLPYIRKNEYIPRHIKEFLILLGMWEARDKQLMQRIDCKLKEDKE